MYRLETGMTDDTTADVAVSSEPYPRSRPERAPSLVRLAAAFVTVVLSMLALLLGRIAPLTFVVLFVASTAMAGANGARLFRLQKGPPRTKVGPCLLIGLDIVFVMLLTWVCGGTSTGAPIHLFLLGGLAVTIGLASLYHIPAAPLFAGGMSVAAYAVFQLVRIQTGVVTPARAVEVSAPACALIVLTTVLARNVSVRFRSAVREMIPSTLRYHSLIERLPEVLFALDGDGRFVWVSNAAPSVLGAHQSTLTGRRLDEVVAVPADFRMVKQGMRGTYRLRGREDVTVDCAVWAAPRDSADAWEGFLADVSERERAVTQREEMMTRLYQYQKMESLGTLAGGMAHDFRNVLQTVGDVTEEILGKTGEESTREGMRRIGACVADARFLLTELLSLGDKDVLDFELVEMNTFIADAARRLGERLGQRYHLSVNGAGTPVYVRGDPHHLSRVMENLVSNARDAMQSGGDITLSCGVEKDGNGAETVVVRVADTGDGIPSDVMHRVFDPFVTSKGPRRGTGLGLALVQHLIALHKGTVEVERTGADGTVFRLSFPAARVLEVDHDTRWLQSRRRNVRLLLLDDDPKIREVLRVFLQDLKYDIGEARNLAEAVSELEQHRDTCRAVIMDWRLETDSPEEVLKALRRVRPDLIAIVVSGYAPDKRAMKAYGIRKWFTKPYDKNLLDIEIQRSLYLAGRPGEHGR